MIKKIIFFSAVLFFSLFALNAQTGQIQAGSIINGKDGKPAGVVFHYDAQTGTGLMVSLVDAQLPWGAMDVNIEQAVDYINSAVAGNDFSGLVNTAAIVSKLGIKTDYAARWCFELNAGGLTGWYMPSSGELNMLYSKRQVVNQALQNAKATTLSGRIWSSTEGNEDMSWSVSFGGGDNYPLDKNSVNRVRAIRKF